MDKNQLNFNLAVRDWATSQSYTMVTTGDDEKLAVKYKSSGDSWSDEELELRKTGITRHLDRLAFDYELAVSLDFADLGYGDLAVFIKLKTAIKRDEAACEYLDILNLGPRMSAEQFQRMIALKKRFGFI